MGPKIIIIKNKIRYSIITSSHQAAERPHVAFSQTSPTADFTDCYAKVTYGASFHLENVFFLLPVH